MDQNLTSSAQVESISASERLFDETFLRKLERLAILSRRAMAGQLQGERRSPKRGQSVEFADFRPYTMGDDIRRIDWNAYARLERFFIKLFVEEEDLTVHLLVDSSRSMQWGKPEKLGYAVRSAGALGYIALAGLDRVTTTVLGGTGSPETTYLSPRRGKGQALTFFNFLQNIKSGGRTNLKTQLRNYAASSVQPGPLLLFTDLFDEGWADGLRALAGRGFDVSVLHILAPDEIEPTLSGDLKLVDRESGREVEITADYDLLQRYLQNLDSWRAELTSFCAARGMHYIPLDTAIPIEQVLFAMLRQQGIVR